MKIARTNAHYVNVLSEIERVDTSHAGTARAFIISLQTLDSPVDGRQSPRLLPRCPAMHAMVSRKHGKIGGHASRQAYPTSRCESLLELLMQTAPSDLRSIHTATVMAHEHGCNVIDFAL